MKGKNKINQATLYVGGTTGENTTGENTTGSEVGSTCKCIRRNVGNSCMVKKLLEFRIFQYSERLPLLLRKDTEPKPIYPKKILRTNNFR
jgi:hypothetical protein